MPHATVKCPKCRRVFSPAQVVRRNMQFCRYCQSPVQVIAFPALYRAQDIPMGERVIDDVSSCFFHPANKAAQVCSSCGRFLCALCVFDMGEQELCPHCVAKGCQQGRSQFTVHSHRYDNMALALVTVAPIVVFPAMPFSAAAAIFLAVRAWRRPPDVLPLSRVKLALAILLALLQWVGIILGAVYLFAL